MFEPPPVPIPSYDTCKLPNPEHYFRRPLFLWRPQAMWGFPFKCLKPECKDEVLRSCGFSATVKDVYSLRWTYYFGQELLKCKGCNHRYNSSELNSQLPLHYRNDFRLCDMKMFCCDKEVIELLRGASAGSNFTNIRTHIFQLHSKEHTQRVLKYETAVSAALERREIARKLGAVHMLADSPILPPKIHFIPKQEWFINVYREDWCARQHTELLPAIAAVPVTEIIRMDSTASCLKHLSHTAKKHVKWVTNLMNGDGQLLQSVLTQGEGLVDLIPMATSFMQRISRNAEKPPLFLYVDCECCTDFYHNLFDPSRPALAELSLEEAEMWKNLKVLLDPWHLMCRLDAGLTSSSHSKAGIFMAGLSSCIFEYDPVDLEAVRTAYQRRLQMKTGHEEDYKEHVDFEISKQDLRRYALFFTTVFYVFSLPFDLKLHMI